MLFRWLRGGQRHERQYAADALNDFAQRNHDFRRPEAAFFERHELDEAHDDVFFAGEAGEAFDFCRR